jgi:hypothetical protein
MYSVMKFIKADKSLLEVANLIGHEINSIKAGAYEGIRKAGDGFACEVSDLENWEEHQKLIISFIQELKQPIVRSKSIGFKVVLDVAIEPEDLKSVASFFKFNSELLTSLVACQVDLEFSVYRPK